MKKKMDEQSSAHISEQELEEVFNAAINEADLAEEEALKLDSIAHSFNSERGLQAAAQPGGQRAHTENSRTKPEEPTPFCRRDTINMRLASCEKGYSSKKVASLTQRQIEKSRKENLVEIEELELKNKEIIRFFASQQNKLDEWKGFIQRNVRQGILVVLSDFSLRKVETPKILGLDKLHEYIRQARSIANYLLDNLRLLGREKSKNSVGHQIRDEFTERSVK